MFVNNQRKININEPPIREFAATLPEAVVEATGASFDVALISDRRMTELNRFFRDKEGTTDVLSFRNEPDEFESAAQESEDGTPIKFLGDIVISAEQAERQAAENKLTLEAELKQLILHGLLHLCGYNHETDQGEMNRRELELRRALKI